VEKPTALGPARADRDSHGADTNCHIRTAGSRAGIRPHTAHAACGPESALSHARSVVSAAGRQTIPDEGGDIA